MRNVASHESASETTKTSPAVPALLFFVGVVHWCVVFDMGDIPFSMPLDWAQESMYYSVVREALESFEIPYHTSANFHHKGESGGTNRFWGFPEILVSPQVLLLPFMATGTFMLFNVLLLYAAGFVGCLLLMKRYRLSPVAFTALFLLFNFNGFITAHLATGHLIWSGYFLLPLFFLFVFEMVEDDRPRRLSLKFALVLFAMMLQGSFHFFVWCCMFLALLALFRPRHSKPVGGGIVLAGLLSLFRLLPAMVAFKDKKHLFISGYPSPDIFFQALVVLRDCCEKMVKMNLNIFFWHELDIYIGVAGLLVIVYFGIWLRFKKTPPFARYAFSALDAPIIVMTLLSFGAVYGYISQLPLPFVNVERVSTRFIVMPLTALIILSGIRIQAFIETYGESRYLKPGSLIALTVLAIPLAWHSALWRVNHMKTLFWNKLAPIEVHIIHTEDALYKTVSQVSAATSFITLMAVVLFIATRRRGTEGSP